MTETKQCQFCGGENIWVNEPISVPCCNCLPQDPTTPGDSDPSASMAKMVEDAERSAFEKEFSHLLTPKQLRRSPFWVYPDSQAAAAWEGWQARAKHQRPCRGVQHPNCNYLAACGSICDKCGQAT